MSNQLPVLTIDTEGGGDPRMNPPTPLHVRLARRRLSVIRSSHDEQRMEKNIDGSGPDSKMNRRNSVVQEEKIPVFTRYAALSKVGYVPFNSNKVNQDRACKVLNYGNDENKVFFGCFDGHGSVGHDVSQYVSTNLPNFLLRQTNLKSNPVTAIEQGFIECNRALARSQIDCTFSGTTVIVCYLDGKTLYSCNAGDSRAVLATRQDNSSRLKAVPLSDDHKPENPEEKKRILQNKGRVQACKGHRGEPVGPQRVWLEHQNVPGLAMSRSFGDLVAASVGVIPRPDVWTRTLTSNDVFMILASDGVWEFISNEEAVAIVEACTGPQEACRALVDESIRRWQDEEDVIDDITAMVVYF